MRRVNQASVNAALTCVKRPFGQLVASFSVPVSECRRRGITVHATLVTRAQARQPSRHATDKLLCVADTRGEAHGLPVPALSCPAL